jgi:ABC-type polysaccharide/polyol phosphate export permease
MKKELVLVFQKNAILGKVKTRLAAGLGETQALEIYRQLLDKTYLALRNFPVPIWTYFSDCLVKTSTVFKDNAGVFGKVYFPRLIIPLSIIVSNLIKFALQSVLFVLVLLYYVYFKGDVFQLHTTSFLFMLPVFLLLMALLGLSLGMIISSLTTK